MNTRIILALPLATTIACGADAGGDVELDLAPLASAAPETQLTVLAAIEQSLGRPAGGVDTTDITVTEGTFGMEENAAPGADLTAGDYETEVIAVYYASDAKDGRSLGDIAPMTLTEGGSGLVMDGFIDVQTSDGDFNGFGMVVDTDPTYDCSTEWSRGVSGFTDGDGTTTMDVTEMIVVTGKQCGLTDMGDTGIQEFHMRMLITPAA